MSKLERMPGRAAWPAARAALLPLWLAACAMIGDPEVIAGNATTVTFRWAGGSPPDEAAAAYCAGHERTAVYQGGVEVGPGGGNLYAYDCVERPPR